MMSANIGALSEHGCSLCGNRFDINENCCCKLRPGELKVITRQKWLKRANLFRGDLVCPLHYDRIATGMMFGCSGSASCCAPFHVGRSRNEQLKRIPHNWHVLFDKENANRVRYLEPKYLCWTCYKLTHDVINTRLQDQTEDEVFENLDLDEVDLSPYLNKYVSPRQWLSMENLDAVSPSHRTRLSRTSKKYPSHACLVKKQLVYSPSSITRGYSTPDVRSARLRPSSENDNQFELSSLDLNYSDQMTSKDIAPDSFVSQTSSSTELAEPMEICRSMISESDVCSSIDFTSELGASIGANGGESVAVHAGELSSSVRTISTACDRDSGNESIEVQSEENYWEAYSHNATPLLNKAKVRKNVQNEKPIKACGVEDIEEKTESSQQIDASAEENQTLFLEEYEIVKAKQIESKIVLMRSYAEFDSVPVENDQMLELKEGKINEEEDEFKMAPMQINATPSDEKANQIQNLDINENEDKTNPTATPTPENVPSFRFITRLIRFIYHVSTQDGESPYDQYASKMTY